LTAIFILAFGSRGYAASVNDGFDPNVNGTVYAVVVQSDGKIVIGGDFSTVSGTARNNIARLNVDGTLDAAFDPDADDEVYALAVQANGKITVGGEFTVIGGVQRRHIARLNADGSVDAAWNPGANGIIRGLLLQEDGKLVVGGISSPSAASPGAAVNGHIKVYQFWSSKSVPPGDKVEA
jgi:uncharacterized delta-60 repeat protein